MIFHRIPVLDLIAQNSKRMGVTRRIVSSYVSARAVIRPVYYSDLYLNTLGLHYIELQIHVEAYSGISGRLFNRVDLIKPISNVRPSVRPSVRACVRTYTCTESFFNFNEIWHVGRCHDSMQCDPIHGQGQGHEPLKVGNPAIFKSSESLYTFIHRVTVT